MKGSFSDSRAMPRGDEACVRACVCEDGGSVVCTEAKGITEKIFLLLKLVPVFSHHVHLPQRVYSSVWGVQ